MRVLVLGQGGREHGLIQSLSSSPVVEKVFALPGREGFAPPAERVTLSSQNLMNFTDETSLQALRLWLKKNPLDLVVVGPERELAEGAGEFFRSRGVAVFGPSREASRLESSKLFAKQFMTSVAVPTAPYQVVRSVKESESALKKMGGPPVVLKADGLAAGKGVFICQNQKELTACAEDMFEKQTLGPAGHLALVEKFETGRELSVLVLTNGEDFQYLPVAQDYKKRYKDNTGPNTGGMGAVAPCLISESLRQQITNQITLPTLKGVWERKLLYRGVLYMGLMITPRGPVVLEYNVRFGDPEAQVILPLLEGDWAKVFLGVARGCSPPPLKWKKNTYAACVVLAHPNYPASPLKPVALGRSLPPPPSPQALLKPPEWLQLPRRRESTDGKHRPASELSSFPRKRESTPGGDSYFLHSGTSRRGGQWISAGGRVLNAVGVGTSLSQALKKAYHLAGQVEGLHFREDIGS